MSHLYDLPDLEMLARDCLIRAGVGAPAADAVARDVALAEASGEADSGFTALLRDIRLIRYGRIHLDAKVTITTPAPTVVRVDANHGLGAFALVQAAQQVIDVATSQGIGLVHLTRASNPGAMAGTMTKVASHGFAAVAIHRDGPTYAVAPGGHHVAPLASGAPGMLNALLELAPPAADSPLDGPVSHVAWLAVLDPDVTAMGDLMAELSGETGAGPSPSSEGIAVAPDLLVQLVNA